MATRKKASVAESLADEIKRRIGEETMVSDLTYDLRSGDPDFIDKLVALTFGNMAYDAILEGKTGLMSAMMEGCYDLVPIPEARTGTETESLAASFAFVAPNVANMTIAAIIDNRTTALFIAALRVLIEQGGCISAAFLSRERDFRNGSFASFWPSTAASGLCPETDMVRAARRVSNVTAMETR
jgi:hypothetical protein